MRWVLSLLWRCNGIIFKKHGPSLLCEIEEDEVIELPSDLEDASEYQHLVLIYAC